MEHINEVYYIGYHKAPFTEKIGNVNESIRCEKDRIMQLYKSHDQSLGEEKQTYLKKIADIMSECDVRIKMLQNNPEDLNDVYFAYTYIDPQDEIKYHQNLSDINAAINESLELSREIIDVIQKELSLIEEERIRAEKLHEQIEGSVMEQLRGYIKKIGLFIDGLNEQTCDADELCFMTMSGMLKITSSLLATHCQAHEIIKMIKYCGNISPPPELVNNLCKVSFNQKDIIAIQESVKLQKNMIHLYGLVVDLL